MSPALSLSLRWERFHRGVGIKCIKVGFFYFSQLGNGIWRRWKAQTPGLGSSETLSLLGLGRKRRFSPISGRSQAMGSEDLGGLRCCGTCPELWAPGGLGTARSPIEKHQKAPRSFRFLFPSPFYFPQILLPHGHHPKRNATFLFYSDYHRYHYHVIFSFQFIILFQSFISVLHSIWFHFPALFHYFTPYPQQNLTLTPSALPPTSQIEDELPKYFSSHQPHFVERGLLICKTGSISSLFFLPFPADIWTTSRRAQGCSTRRDVYPDIADKAAQGSSVMSAGFFRHFQPQTQRGLKDLNASGLGIAGFCPGGGWKKMTKKKNEKYLRGAQEKGTRVGAPAPIHSPFPPAPYLQPQGEMGLGGKRGEK